MITHDARRSLSRGNNPVPSPWQATKEPHVFRVPCTVITGTFAAATQRLKLRLKFRGSIGVP